MDSIAQMLGETTLQVRSMRKRGWFWIANVVYERYGELIGLPGLGLYAALARHADNDTGAAWPSLALLAKRFGCDQRTIRTHLQALVDAKLIKVQDRPGQAPLITMLEFPDDPPALDPCTKCEGATEPAAPPVTPPVAVPAPTMPSPTPAISVRDEDLKKTQEEKPPFSSSLSRKEKTDTGLQDETSSWSKTAVAFPARERPDALLATLGFLPGDEDYGNLLLAAEAELKAEGTNPDHVITPIKQDRMLTILVRDGTIPTPHCPVA